MRQKPVILWMGDASCVTTGFGRVANNVLNGLFNEDKYTIVQYGLNYYGDPHSERFDIYPIRTDDKHGRNRLFNILLKVKPDVFVTNNDIWALTYVRKVLNLAMSTLRKTITWVAYFPIDGLPINPKWVNMIENEIDIPITYTKWAADNIKKVSDTCVVDYIGHGVDTDVFCPDDSVKKEVKAQLSKELGRDINFIVGYVGRNQPRKRLPELMLAFKSFYDKNKDSVLYLHTSTPDMGWDLNRLMEVFGLEKGSIIITPDLSVSNGYTEDRLVAIYQAFDVLALPTIGEGFGLTLVEGMSTECAILSTDCSVVPEIVGDASGILVKPGSLKVIPNDNELIRPIPSIEAMLNALYYLKGNHSRLGKNGRKRVKEMYSNWCIDKWVITLDEAVEMSKPKKIEVLDFNLGFEEIL